MSSNDDDLPPVITDWEEICTRPKFEQKIDHEQIKLKEVIRPYHIMPQQPCGLKECGTSHNHGFLIEMDDGSETNIGHLCARKYYDLEFKFANRSYKIRRNAKQYREDLISTKFRLDLIRKQVQELKYGDHNGEWCYDNMRKQMLRLLPSSISESLTIRAKRGNGIVSKDVSLTEDEKQIAKQMGKKDQFKTEAIFIINGVTSVTSYPKIRKILDVNLGKKLEAFSQLDIQSADYKELKQWSTWSNNIDRWLLEAKNLIEECNRFLMPANIKNIRKNQHYM